MPLRVLASQRAAGLHSSHDIQHKRSGARFGASGAGGRPDVLVGRSARVEGAAQLLSWSLLHVRCTGARIFFDRHQIRIIVLYSALQSVPCVVRLNVRFGVYLQLLRMRTSCPRHWHLYFPPAARHRLDMSTSRLYFL